MFDLKTIFIQANLIIKPTISANKRVNVPSEVDLKKSDRYLLTHQEHDNNRLQTTLVKGEIVDTRMGGVQVKFIGKERLTSSAISDSNS